MYQRNVYWIAGVLLLALTTSGCHLYNSRPDFTSTSLTELPASRSGHDPVAHPPLDHDQKDGFRLADFNVDNLNSVVKKAAGQEPNPEVARTLYVEAEAKYQQASAAVAEESDRTSLFRDAAKGFKRAATRFPESQLEEDALFLAAESLFFSDQYPKASELYAELLKKYPNSKHLDVVESRRFSIAKYWLDVEDEKPESFYQMNVTDKSLPWRDRFGHAVKTFDRIRFDDPTGKLADDATMAQANAYFRKGEYLRADQLYADLRETFPTSEHQFHAHLFAVEAKLKSYQGPDYAGDALKEAEKLIVTMRRQFPQQSEEQLKYLKGAYAEVRYRQAEREMFMGRFFAKRGRNKSARFYYQSVLEDFQDVPVMVEKATERLASLEGKRDVPVDRWSWVEEWLPDSDGAPPLIMNNPASSFNR